MALATLLAILAAPNAPLPVHAAPTTIGRYASVNGIRLYYEVQGKGSPLLLLHGGAGDGRQFEKQLPAFTPRHRCIVPDSRAQGRSTDGPGPLTFHQMAEDMLALLDQLHVRRVDIMGWSDGGVIGLDLAMHHPERVRRVVTFGANFRADGLNQPDIDWNASANAESFGPGMKEAYQKQNPDPAHYETAMNKVIAMWRSLPQWTPEQLGTIRARVLVGAGEHDVIRREHSEALARAIPHAELWVVPGASHSVMIERPDLVNPKVLEFLERN